MFLMPSAGVSSWFTPGPHGQYRLPSSRGGMGERVDGVEIPPNFSFAWGLGLDGSSGRGQ